MLQKPNAKEKFLTLIFHSIKKTSFWAHSGPLLAQKLQKKFSQSSYKSNLILYATVTLYKKIQKNTMHSFLIKLETPFSGPILGPFWVIKPQNKIFMMTFYDNFMQKIKNVLNISFS